MSRKSDRKSAGTTWNTKYGTRRVRHDPPTVAEAIAAARDLSDEPDQQVEIAAALMGMSLEAVKKELAKTPPQPRSAKSGAGATTVAFTSRAGVQRAVVVERKPSRRIAPGARPAATVKLNSAR